MTQETRAFPQNLSPLDVLEQNSRRLADRLQTKDGRDSPVSRGPSLRMGTPTATGRDGRRQPSQSSLTSEQISQIMRQQPPAGSPATALTKDSESEEWTPDSRSSSYFNRHASISSVASIGGGILDSFRLSSLPNFGQNDDARSIRSDRTSIIDNSDAMTLTDAHDDDDDPYQYEDHGPDGAEADGQYDDGRHPHMSRSDSAASQLTARGDNAAARQPINRSDSVASYSSIRSVSGPVTTGPSASGPASNRLKLQTNIDSSAEDTIPSPASSTNSDNASLYSAMSSFGPKPSRPSLNPTPSSNTNRTNSQYFFTDFGRSRSYQKPPTTSAPTTPGLMVPPMLRQPSHKSTAGSSPSVKDDDAPINKMFKDMTLEEHVTVGIQMHERGDLREASYHWQYAAFKGDATAMLLYGLALRHGWGMRQNPTEAVKWLRKAMESSIGDAAGGAAAGGAELSKGSDLMRPGTMTSLVPADDETSRIKRAHIGLALYELGMSYLHSWGTEKDEDMALRSFEMAGSMGDSDALCEAAALYMHNGPKGRKKDLQKAARLYREAADRGASMVGQSWIYKDKYMGDEKKKKDKKKK